MYETRRKKVFEYMEREGIALLMLEDFEGRRDKAVRWLTGHPGDALLFLGDKRSLLVPWDINLAMRLADAGAKIPYQKFQRSAVTALAAAAEYFRIPAGARIEVPAAVSYPRFLKFLEKMDNYDLLCRDEGAAAELARLRSVKDEGEIALYRKGAAITNQIIEALEARARSGQLVTETDAALFIAAAGRSLGCEGTGFETLAAGPSRSFGIHAFPAYTSAPFAAPGLSILDFGLNYGGYTTDVTLTFARGPLSPLQERMIALVEKAAALALSMSKPGVPVRDIAAAVDALFAKDKKVMPHGLGHGIGLDAHEAPFLRPGAAPDLVLEPGMIFTLEPGLYEDTAGGCRLENDVLVTPGGPEVLTASRVVRL